MPQRVHVALRLLAGAVAALSAVAGIGLALAFDVFESPVWPAAGCLGALAAAAVLFRVASRGTPLNRREGVIVLVGGTAVVAILTILAREFSHSYDKSYMAAMKSDLRSVVEAEDRYFEEHRAYTGTLADLATTFSPSPRVTIVLDVSDSSVHAVATYDALPGVRCVAFLGTGPFPPATEEREPACTR